jgi:dienelactone hydrolase
MPAATTPNRGVIMTESTDLRTVYQKPGIIGRLPVFTEAAIARMDFPLSWLSGNFDDYPACRAAAREKLIECFLTRPPVCDFDPVVIGQEDRGSYIAQRVVLSLSVDSRVLAYVLVPKGQGPFPAVQLHHDHSGSFTRGKEKVIRPFDEPEERITDAVESRHEAFGGKFIGDELAKRGYLCFATDMFFFSDRGGMGREGQEIISSNLLHMGMSLAGLAAHDDMRSLEYLVSRPDVDATRVAAAGLSVGCYRTWQLCAATDLVKAGIAVGWMGTIAGQIRPGINQSAGGAAYTMLHPNLHNYLDYPDVAAIACPKPMLFYNGLRDGLFPADDVRVAFDKMRAVWDSQSAGDKLVTKLWDCEHVFDTPMQAEAFDWLDDVLGR